MHCTSTHLIHSATDLSNFLACPHLTLLDRAVARGAAKPRRFDDPGLEVLQRRGHEHEQAYLASLREEGRSVIEPAGGDPSLPPEERWPTAAEETMAALRSGVDVVYQGTLFDGTWLGKPDFLMRLEQPSNLGSWSYEVVDTKLAREAKGGALLQVLLYADLLAKVQGVPPEHVVLALGGPDARDECFRVAEYAAYFRSIRDRYLDWVATQPDPRPAPDPVPHCDVCAWRLRCDGERHDADHLSLVAGITAGQRRALGERLGIDTLAGLARLELPVTPRLDGVSAASLERVQKQAAVQLRGREEKRPCRELILPVTPEQGLAALPAPSPGDLFFDIEGDPYALTHGLEYLFGFADRDGRYTGWRALDRAAEKAVFERFIDAVMDRLERWPDMHVYHYAPYEPTALKRLMGFHATREQEVDRLLRGKVLVDLYRVVHQGVRASVESYSIKKMEPFYGFTRDVDLRSASAALADFEAWLELGQQGADSVALLDAIEAYNRDDCLSTLRLQEWLEGLRAEAEAQSGQPVPRPTPTEQAPSEDQQEREEEVARLVAALTSDVPADPDDRTREQQSRWLLAQLLGYHRREAKSVWWEYYRCLELDDQELIEDRATLGGLEYAGVAGTVKRSLVHRYRFPDQEHGIKPGDNTARDHATKVGPGTITAIDDVAREILIRRGKTSRKPHPQALVPLEYVSDTEMRDSLQATAQAVLQHGLGEVNPHGAAMALLTRQPPLPGAASVAHPGESPQAAALRLATSLERAVLPIQGPPGSGKTYTGAHMIVRALRAGKRVGITATSHKVISHLLEKACEAGREEGFGVRGIQKANDDQSCGAPGIEATNDNGDVREALATGRVALAAGTAWLWSRPDMIGSVDLLVVDEAGQFSLANALAVAPAADSMVLLGDPRQLEQPQKGSHPPGADVSALDHLLDGAATMPAHRGLFLDRTHRLSPDICVFTSEIFYESRLRALDGLDVQAVLGAGTLAGAGLRLMPVAHTGNSNESPEEVEEVRRLFAELLSGAYQWRRRRDEEREDGRGGSREEICAIELGDILVVAPYNAQVSALGEALPPGARVGTVDRFQGQEAPIVIYSMASSSAEDAPRDMRFLYSPNRLNVATSRALCLAVIVASPAIFTPDCRTPEQMRLANAFCRFSELAAGQAGDPPS